ncbi:hypothetical protein KAH55_06400 [bacterium]|nr:hypothetical protein [bacterium]
MTELIRGNSAFAAGIIDAGIELILARPGIPGAQIIESILLNGLPENRHVEWVDNPAWAIELATGAATAGAPCLVNLTPEELEKALEPAKNIVKSNVRNGLLLLAGDTRRSISHAEFSESHLFYQLPRLEPAGVEEGYRMVCQAVTLSTQYQMPIILNVTAYFGQLQQQCDADYNQKPLSSIHPQRQILPYLDHKTAQMQFSHNLSRLRQLAEVVEFNSIEGKGNIGIVAAGETYTKLRQVLGRNFENQFHILKLGLLNPLPEARLGLMFEQVKYVLVLEDNLPLVEQNIQKLTRFLGSKTPILGRLSGHLPYERELQEWQIEEVLNELVPSFRKRRPFFLFPKPEKFSSREEECKKCKVMQALEQLTAIIEKSFIEKPPIIVDKLKTSSPILPDYPHLLQNSSLAAAAGLATGISQAMREQRVIVITDTSNYRKFGVNSFLRAAIAGANILLIIVEYHGASHENGKGRELANATETTRDIERLVDITELAFIQIIDLRKQVLEDDEIHTALQTKGPSVLILKTNCPFYE